MCVCGRLHELSDFVLKNRCNKLIGRKFEQNLNDLHNKDKSNKSTPDEDAGVDLTLLPRAETLAIRRWDAAIRRRGANIHTTFRVQSL